MTTDSRFLQPDPSLAELSMEELHQRLNIPIYSGHRADFFQFRGLSPAFDDIVARASAFNDGYEDQCSAQYYYDLFDCVQSADRAINRVVEVGVFMGGASVILAGCADITGLELDLVDITRPYLHFTHERIRRTFPDQAPRVRMFHGDLPTYVRDVLMQEPDVRALVQHDGAHIFNQVVCDLSALSFVRPQVYGLAIQDTHLRGVPPRFNFVDAAVCAVFGFQVAFAPMGVRYKADNEVMMTPNRFQGNYFLPERPEGMFVPMEGNEFQYPHPSIPLDAFLPNPGT